MTKLKIRTGDKVRIMTGDNKGQEGEVQQVFIQKNKAIVAGANMVSKHQKPSASSPQGGIVKKEAAIAISNLALIDPTSGEATRVGYRLVDGKKVRFSKKSNEEI